ncbi:hypothetical protein [Streptomyces sp.]|uniref:hypothetical protein n=1 Tax=Streptomyces sp. TaxID=1931 RepID=UPI002F40BD96
MHRGQLRLRLSAPAVALLALLLCALALAGGAFAPAARSASGIDTVAAQLKKGPVHVDPRASGELSPVQADALATKIKQADKPVFVAVLPAAAEFAPQTVLQDLRSAVGISGVYAVRLGDRFNAGADPQVMPRNAVSNLVGQVRRSSAGNADAELTSFVDQAVQQARGSAPGSWSGHTAGGGVTAAVVLGALVLLTAGGGYVLFRRARNARIDRERVQLERLRTVVDEDITAFGEELDRLDFTPSDPRADEAMRDDYVYALDAYERAKALMAAARGPDDVRPVTEALEEGRFALATLAARRSGEPLPERRPPCFFDPRHGPSVSDVPWAPPGGVPREVPACAADAARIDDGEEPMSRTVPTSAGPQPYWNAGPAYGPWAGGYFGGGLLPGLLIGTLLGGAFGGPGYGYGSGYEGGGTGPDGGDYSGSDFDPGDFGGGFGDGGGFQ